MPPNVKPAKRRRKIKPKRKTFLIDSETLMDLGVVQSALRATSAAEALRVSVRKMAELVRAANKGKQIQEIDPTGKEPAVCLDIPHIEVRA